MQNTGAVNRCGDDQIPQHCVTRCALRVRFSATDGMGIVGHARFFDYFEVAREEYMRRRGVDFDCVFAAGHNLPMAQAQLRFDRPARFGDLLTVEIRLAHLSRARLRFEYHVLAEGGGTAAGRLAYSWTDHVFTTQDLTLCRIPCDFMQQLLSAERQDGNGLCHAQNGQPQSET